ncbi:MAG: serine protease [Chloroflexota bacterium]|nr:serine protease [Chloroflexota bacterium]
MALLPPNYMDAVVALGTEKEKGEFLGTATGFLYGAPTGAQNEEGNPFYRIFLVTNRHVVEGIDQLTTRFNRSETLETRMYNIPLRNPDGSIRWTLHPDPKCDVAVIPILVDKLKEDGIQFYFFPGDSDTTITVELARERGTSEGDGVFVLGFPLGMSGGEYNYTIVRQGNIARIRDWLNGRSNTFLIDASVFPGNSGGPVIIKPEAVSIRGTTANKRAYLMGMVSAYIPYEDVAVSQQSGKARAVFVENSGLGIVVPMNIIKETVSLAVETSKSRDGSNQFDEELPEQPLEPVRIKSNKESPATRKPLGQWLVDNMPRGTNLEPPIRDDYGRPNPFLEGDVR